MEYAVQQMPGDKILMGIPCYGYDWTGSGQGQGLTWRTIESLVQQYGNVQWDNTNSCLLYTSQSHFGFCFGESSPIDGNAMSLSLIHI